MFRDNEGNSKLVMKALSESEARIGVIGTLPLAVLAAEACRHFDDSDDCSVSVRSSKEHGIQFFYSGCEVHAMMLASLMNVHMQKIVDAKQFAGLDHRTDLEAKLLLIRIAQVVDGNTDLALEIQTKPVVEPPKPPKKKED